MPNNKKFVRSKVASTSASEIRSLPASKRKLHSDVSSEDDEGVSDGFRLIDISILMSIFSSFLCPKCKSGHVVMEEDTSAKMGLVSQLSFKCSARMCTYSKVFYSSSRVKNSKAFEANRRSVLAMRNIGVGDQGLVKFCGVMNMLSPMNANSYNDHVMAIHGAAEVVAKNSMKHAAEELNQFYKPKDGLYDVGISVDGTWRRRGYSSSYGVVTGISLRATKETHSSLPTLELATFLPVGVFNDGSKAILDVLQNMGITPGYNTKAGMKKMDYDRLRHSTRKGSEKQKSWRKRIRQRKKGYFDKLTEKEGTHYEAGAF
ncbi:uncharacterized protein LOC124456591 [Xenia sp. Carnegie-2017]|uniref:uncharacterized protein LOC124456591 n=1 Tax=Xenia sp. Carnegie-2017 TaxID=2897299 RepID=UPI001F0400C2|nr:uncharacterized protein LOC124456591 [Xenia sp. Carnegie-2017]